MKIIRSLLFTFLFTQILALSVFANTESMSFSPLIFTVGNDVGNNSDYTGNPFLDSIIEGKTWVKEESHWYGSEKKYIQISRSSIGNNWQVMGIPRQYYSYAGGMLETNGTLIFTSKQTTMPANDSNFFKMTVFNLDNIAHTDLGNPNFFKIRISLKEALNAYVSDFVGHNPQGEYGFVELTFRNEDGETVMDYHYHNSMHIFRSSDYVNGTNGTWQDVDVQDSGYKLQ